MTSNLLIFDLDETLVHAATEQLARPADFEYAPYFVYKRPFLLDLLVAAKPLYDFAVWSSSSREYVDAVVAEIFAGFDVKSSWAVERCIQRVDAQSNGYVYIKDLRRVQSHGYPVERPRCQNSCRSNRSEKMGAKTGVRSGTVRTGIQR